MSFFTAIVLFVATWTITNALFEVIDLLFHKKRFELKAVVFPIVCWLLILFYPLRSKKPFDKLYSLYY